MEMAGVMYKKKRLGLILIKQTLTVMGTGTLKILIH